MTVELMGLLVAAWLGNAEVPGKPSITSWLPDVAFRPRERSVSNWRSEAATHIESSYGTAINILLGREPSQVTRCVRLNNYWCIKRAGWAGEIAADTEGHVAFASAAEGADVAALLLRRYYLDYGRHSALAIISHWAPASCGVTATAVARIPRPRRARMALVRASPADHLAIRGIGRTLRARFLASRGHRMGGGMTARPRRSVIPERPIGTAMPAPAIAVGLGEKPISLGDRSLVSIYSTPLGTGRSTALGSGPLIALGSGPSAALGSAAPTPSAGPGFTCISDSVRIQNYAAKAAAGVAATATDDLRLFDPSGKPTPNLARVMHNMSAVEIGPLGANKALIAAAVDHAAALAVRQAALPAGSASAKDPTPLANR